MTIRMPMSGSGEKRRDCIGDRLCASCMFTLTLGDGQCSQNFARLRSCSRITVTLALFNRWPGDFTSMFCAAKSRSEEHTSELQSLAYLVCRLLLEKKKKKISI